MGSSGVNDPTANTQITVDWAASLIDALDVAYDEIDTLQADLATLEAALAAVPTEGDYSTYTLKHEIQSSTDDHYFRPENCWIPDESLFLYVSSGNDLMTVNISEGTIINSGVQTYRGHDTLYVGRSIFGKYFATCDWSDGAWLKIYKNGVLIQTIDIDAENDNFSNPSVSPSGKYILLFYWDNSEAVWSDRYKIRIYEGSA